MKFDYLDSRETLCQNKLTGGGDKYRIRSQEISTKPQNKIKFRYSVFDRI